MGSYADGTETSPPLGPGSARPAWEMRTPGGPGAVGSYADGTESPPGGLDLHALRGKCQLLGVPPYWGHTRMGPRPLPPGGPDLHALRRPWALLDALGPKALHQTSLFPKALDRKGL